jgi:hypothetical protein
VSAPVPKSPLVEEAERMQEARDAEHLEYLVRIFVGCRDAEFVRALAYRLLAVVGR